MKRREKKSESLDIRLPFQLKQEFMEATRKRGETASGVLREFINSYIEEARLAEHPNTVQEITMTLARHRIKTLATAAGAALGVFSLTALPSAADPSAFDALDKNKDGVITEGEIAPGFDAGIIAELDSDGSGGVSQEELEAAGDRIVIETNSIHGDADDDGVTTKVIQNLRWIDDEEGKLHGIISTNVDKQITVERLHGGDELSNDDLRTLIEKALEDGEVHSGKTTQIKVIVHRDESEAHQTEDDANSGD